MTMADEKIMMVMMAVTDMAKAKAFYAEQLGFQVTKDVGQGGSALGHSCTPRRRPLADVVDAAWKHETWCDAALSLDVKY